jgi:hypothetical protein
MKALRLTLACLLLLPSSGVAQAPPGPTPDWSAVQALPSRACLLVVTTGQRQWKGRLTGWDGPKLLLQVARRATLLFPAEDVLRLGVYKKCSSARSAFYGALFGFSIGFGAMAIGTQSLCVNCEPGETGLLGALIVGGVVGGLSAWVASRSSDQPVRWVYLKQ